MEDNQKKPQEKLPVEAADKKVPIAGYIILVVAILIFSGVLAKMQGWNMFDFNTLNGAFGVMKGEKSTFMGAGGAGARAGFLFALSLVPGVMLAMGIIELVEYYGGLKAAQKMLTPILRPILGIPGICVVALVSSLQSTDAGAGMTRGLHKEGFINAPETLVFAAFQFTAGGLISNYLSSGSALFSIMTVPIFVPLVVMLLLKIVGANMMRVYCAKYVREDEF
ncbi:MAG: nucleoside recognition domain-containing protein [Acidaminococcaceae bacterium]|nr:nucleoside recognition domain-containing protein [Acidaminococcaceae bacterium]